MIRLEVKKCNMILTEKLRKYRRQIIGRAKYAYYPLEKVLEKPTEKQVCPLKSLDLSNKKEKLKKIEGIFSICSLI